MPTLWHAWLFLKPCNKHYHLQQRLTQVLDILFNLKAFDLQRKGGVFLKDPGQEFLDMFVLHGNFSEEFIRREQHIPYGACLCGRAAISQGADCFR